MNYLDRQKWKKHLQQAASVSDLHPMQMVEALLEHGEVHIECREIFRHGVTNEYGYVAKLAFWMDEDFIRRTSAEGTGLNLEDALEALCTWTCHLIDEMGVIARCSCGKTYTRQQWRNLPGRRPWFVGIGELLELRECSCKSTISRRLRDALTEYQRLEGRTHREGQAHE